jgi:hypothetical protein
VDKNNQLWLGTASGGLYSAHYLKWIYSSFSARNLVRTLNLWLPDNLTFHGLKFS